MHLSSHSRLVLRHIREVLCDAVVSYSAPSSKDVNNPRVDPLNPHDDDGFESQIPEEGLSVADYVSLAVSRHDGVLRGSETAHQRAYQLLTFSTGTAVFLVGGIQFIWGHLTGPIAFAVASVIVLSLLLSLKIGIHCLNVIALRQTRDLSPAFYRQVAEVLAGKRPKTTDALQILRDIENCHPTNDRSRAIAAEHSALAHHTSMINLVLVTLVLVLVLIGGLYGPGGPPSTDSAQRVLTDEGGSFRSTVTAALPFDRRQDGLPTSCLFGCTGLWSASLSACAQLEEATTASSAGLAACVGD